MTRYEIDCRRCTNTVVGTNGYNYCYPTRVLGVHVPEIEWREGTAEDPDIVRCRYYSEEPRQSVLIRI